MMKMDERKQVASFVYDGSSFKFPVYGGAVTLQKHRNFSNGHTFKPPMFNLLTL